MAIFFVYLITRTKTHRMVFLVTLSNLYQTFLLLESIDQFLMYFPDIVFSNILGQAFYNIMDFFLNGLKHGDFNTKI